MMEGAGAILLASLLIAVGAFALKWWKRGEYWPRHPLAATIKRWRLKHRIRTDVLNILVEYEASLFNTLNERPRLGMFQSAHERVNQQLAEVRQDVRSNQWHLFNQPCPLVIALGVPLPDVPEYAPWARVQVPWTTTYEGFLSNVVPQFEGLFVYGCRLRQEHALWKLKHRRGMGHRRVLTPPGR